jgi:sulfatase maturation enzyme AslB (radical SAM superfamily)
MLLLTDHDQQVKDILFKDALKLGRPVVFNIMAKPTGPLCNLNCTYCYYLEKKKLYPGTNNFKLREASFRSAMEGIELLHKHKVDFNTLSCVNSYNAQFASETYRFLKRIGSGFIQFLPVVERIANKSKNRNLYLVPPAFDGDATVTEWSVTGKEFVK